MSLKVDNLINNLVEKTGIRLTAQRELILKVLINNSDKHLTADDIFILAKKKDSMIGIATIYRTLDLLEKLKIIVKCDFGDDAAKYEYVLKNKRKHHHLICSKCGKVIEVFDLLPYDLEERLLKEEGFQCKDYSLKIYGYCKECRDKLKAAHAK